MAPIKDTKDHEVNVPIHRMWAAATDGSNLFPKVRPEGLKSVEKDGDFVTFHFKNEAAAIYGDYVKEKVSADPANKKLYTEVVESPLLGKVYNSRKAVTTFKPGKSAHSTLVTQEIEIETTGELDQAKAEKAAKDELETLKRVEKYLIENPSLYA